MTFTVGSLVRARGREWVVLPEIDKNLVMVRPLGGTEDEVTGIDTTLESVESAQFALPSPSQLGDNRSSRMLRDAVRLGFRSSAGPFRSAAHVAVEPRPYQLVPLLMALKLDPVRILIADDVGIGKTVEAGLIARELLDRGEIKRLTVLCPPQLAEQWQAELRDKFNISAELVLPSTASRLERNLAIGESLFDVYPFTVVSLDYIKSERHRLEFLRTCPELVVVDEAHTCAFGGEGRHQRHALVSQLAADPARNLILVTATPHSGNEAAFRSLLSLLSPNFMDLPEDLTGVQNEQHRRALAAHFVQRRRGDIKAYLDTQTPFPDREEGEQTYKLTPEYGKLMDKVMRYARETVSDMSGGALHQRVRWWSVLALLRAIASSPAAAAATLRNRAAPADTDTTQEADEVGRQTVFDLIEDGSSESVDLSPGSDYEGEGASRRRLQEMARDAEALTGAQDAKLQQGIQIVQSLLKDGYNPIVFCRFIATADYVADALRAKLGSGVDVRAVTGTLPPAEREARVEELVQSPKRVLVATDCLSEGINLQQGFDAVFHYDLSWNPTRHEQREGRVDRYGQPSRKIRVVTYYGLDNQIDGIVLEVLIKKHKTIRSSLGISVPIPVDNNQLVEAIFEGLLLREKRGSVQGYLPSFEEFLKPQKEELFSAWEASAAREKRSLTVFAQQTIRVDDVAEELRQVREAIGSGVDVSRFAADAVRAHGGVVTGGGSGPLQFDLTETPAALRDAVGVTKFKARFELPIQEGEVYLNRTHPIIEGLATHVMDTALDPIADTVVAHRCGVIRTSAVQIRTTVLLLRMRYHIVTQQGGEQGALLAEDSQLIAFQGSPQNPVWLDSEQAEKLLLVKPDGNVQPDTARNFLDKVLEGFEYLEPHINEIAEMRGEELLEAHRRVRSAARLRGVSQRVEAHLPPDILGVYVYLPQVTPSPAGQEVR